MKQNEVISNVLNEIGCIKSYQGVKAIIVSNHRFQDDFLNRDILLYVLSDLRKKKEIFSEIDPYSRIWVEFLNEGFIKKFYKQIDRNFSLNQIEMFNNIKTGFCFFERNNYLTNLREKLINKFTGGHEFIKLEIHKSFLYSSDAASKIIENDLLSASLLAKESMDHTLILNFTLDNINIFQHGILPRNNWFKVHLENSFPSLISIFSRLNHVLEEFCEDNFERDFAEVCAFFEDIALKINFDMKPLLSNYKNIEFEEL